MRTAREFVPWLPFCLACGGLVGAEPFAAEQADPVLLPATETLSAERDTGASSPLGLGLPGAEDDRAEVELPPPEGPRPSASASRSASSMPQEPLTTASPLLCELPCARARFECLVSHYCGFCHFEPDFRTPIDCSGGCRRSPMDLEVMLNRQPPLVVPGAPERSPLTVVVGNGSMPPQEFGDFPSPTESELAELEQFIERLEPGIVPTCTAD